MNVNGIVYIDWGTYHRENKKHMMRDESFYYVDMEGKYFPWDLIELKCTNKITRMLMRRNCFTKIPDEIASLSNLEFIDLSENKLTELSDGICDLKNLKFLSLEGNELQTLPLSFHKLTKLTALDLDRNKLHWLPQQLCKMDSLERVSVVDNCLLCLPMDIGYMKSLKSLRVNNNPHLHAIPYSLQTQCPSRCNFSYAGCGKYNFEPYSYESRNYSYITVYPDTENDAKHIYLPKEMELPYITAAYRDLNTELKTETSCLSLFEIVIRKIDELGSSLIIQDLPAAMQYIVENPFSCCSVCHSAIFTMFHVTVFPFDYHLRSALKGIFYQSTDYPVLGIGCFCSIRCAKSIDFGAHMKIYTIVKRNNLSQPN